jgi:uncharacterized membrane protein YhaH (DUF805 family)
LWFSLDGRVSRRAYVATGLGLMAFKYAVEALLLWRVTGQVWTPLDYLVPLWSLRASKLDACPQWLLLFLGGWTLPFAWIGAAMSLRRARDAGLPATAGLLFFCPVANYMLMLLLALLPADERRASTPAGPEEGEHGSAWRAALLAVSASTVAALAATLLYTYVFRTYGTFLFLGVPSVLGLITGLRFNYHVDRGLAATLGVVLFALMLQCGLLLLFALEGVLCIAMAAGIAAPVALVGGLFGHALARETRARRAAVLPALLLVPLGALEARWAEPATFEVITAVEVDAPVERVWPNAIAFAELPPPEHWVFQTGVAYPVRARIDGEGVGAVRRCEFSTGAFVEPITRWEPPHRLSFDVAHCPLPMQEWSFYARVRPPHLGRSFRSLRGEFRLVELPGGRTRLEGSTWYALDLRPTGYWRWISDAIVHRIHRRVLEHVRALSEG